MPRTVNTPEIVKEVAKRMGCYQKDASELLDHFVEVVAENVQAGRKVHYRSFGTFYLRPAKCNSKRFRRAGVKFRPAKKMVERMQCTGAASEKEIL